MIWSKVKAVQYEKKKIMTKSRLRCTSKSNGEYKLFEDTLILSSLAF